MRHPGIEVSTTRPSRPVTSGRWISIERSSSDLPVRRSKAADVHATPWDLVVIDEAHRLRNVYKPSNVIANTPCTQALAQKQKLLLTATPLQNSLLELLGLVSFIDEYAFGDLKSFREQFANAAPGRVFNLLRERLKPICHQTLRRQVTTYVPYTRRYPIVEEFTPENGEDKLYDLVSEYLRRGQSAGLPPSQPAVADDTCPSQAAGIVHICDRRRVDVYFAPLAIEAR